MSSIGIRHPHTTRRTVPHLPRGFGLAIGALASLALWAGLVRIALALLGG